MEWRNLAIRSVFSLALALEATSVFHGSAWAQGDHRPIIVTAADLSLSASVEATVNSDEEIPFANISASAKDGAVYLTGFVRSDTERSRAIEDAKSVPGVKTLRDNIVVMRQRDY